MLLLLYRAIHHAKGAHDTLSYGQTDMKQTLRHLIAWFKIFLVNHGTKRRKLYDETTGTLIS